MAKDPERKAASVTESWGASRPGLGLDKRSGVQELQQRRPTA